MRFLPNIFTLLNLFCGYLSLLYVFEGEFFKASLGILIAIFFDVLDGRLARLSGQVTKFGKELDSLADLVSFGIAPAFLIYRFSLVSFGWQGWLISFLYTACVALRLARFNVRSTPLSYFEGLPSPAGGALISSIILLLLFLRIEPEYRSYPLLFLVCLVAFLMVSPIKYPTLKEFKLKGLSTFYFLTLFLFLFVLTASKPPVILFSLVLLYLLLGPILFLRDIGWRIYYKNKDKKREKRKTFDNN